MINEEDLKFDPKHIPIVSTPSKHSPEPIRMFRPIIDLKKCAKNYRCVVSCPKNAISIDKNRLPVIDYSLCDGCLICLRECPAVAINEQRE